MKWLPIISYLSEAFFALVLISLVSVSVLYGFRGDERFSNTVENSIEVETLEANPPQISDMRERMSKMKSEIELTNTIKEILGNQVDNYGIYIKDLGTGKEYTINADETFSPASISKLPYGILTLKYIDQGKLSYYTSLTLQERHKSYKTDPLYEFPNGSSWAITDLLRLLLVDSDNVPMAMLEEYFGGVYSFNDQAAEIGVGGLTRYPHETTPRAVGNIFEKIYTGELLTPESNNVLKGYLSKYKVFSSDRIRRGVLQAGGDGNLVVHKIGNLPGIYHDSGYVESPGGDYVIITLNQNRTPGQSVSEITAISEATYKFFNKSE